MALPSSGEITMDMVRVELKRPTGAISLNDADVRKLAGILSGAISMNDLRGKSFGPSIAFVPSSFSPVTGEDLRLYLIAGGSYEMYDDQGGEELFGTWISPAMEVGNTYPITIKNVAVDTNSLTVTASNIGGPTTQTLAKGQSMSFTAAPVHLNNFVEIIPVGDVTSQTVSIEVTINGTTATYNIYA